MERPKFKHEPIPIPGSISAISNTIFFSPYSIIGKQFFSTCKFESLHSKHSILINIPSSSFSPFSQVKQLL